MTYLHTTSKFLEHYSEIGSVGDHSFLDLYASDYRSISGLASHVMSHRHPKGGHDRQD